MSDEFYLTNDLSMYHLCILYKQTNKIKCLKMYEIEFFLLYLRFTPYILIYVF